MTMPDTNTDNLSPDSKTLDRLVDRFLMWPLPHGVYVDPVCTKPGTGRCGTNLLTANQAREMLKHVLGADPQERAERTDRDVILYAMVEGLHALIYGAYSTGSGDFARQALGDGGSIHEYVHAMLRLLPPRSAEQVQSGGDR
jgi:hypothetical protein